MHTIGYIVVSKYNTCRLKPTGVVIFIFIFVKVKYFLRTIAML
nr:MAG TPA: hypothetical protein [Caudoviricetes sp.]